MLIHGIVLLVSGEGRGRGSCCPDTDQWERRKKSSGLRGAAAARDGLGGRRATGLVHRRAGYLIGGRKRGDWGDRGVRQGTYTPGIDLEGGVEEKVTS